MATEAMQALCGHRRCAGGCVSRSTAKLPDLAPTPLPTGERIRSLVRSCAKREANNSAILSRANWRNVRFVARLAVLGRSGRPAGTE